MIYAAPMGFCLGAAPVIDAGVNKPVLRTAAPAPSVKAAPSAKVAPTALKLEGDISISKGNPKITLSLRDSDVKQVLRMFADKAGLNIIFHSSVEGRATLDLVNMPLNDAFQLVMQVTNLTYYVDNNTMVVASAAAASTLNLSKQGLMSIPVKYADASVIADFLNKNIFSINKPGLSNSQIAITNPGTNEVLIFGTENDYRMAKKIIDKFDTKPTSTTYTVNHTTPKEMADLLCTVLFPPAPGAAASAAAAPSAGAGGPLSLGAGVVACTYNNQVTAGALTSLAAKSMAITYFPQHGTVAVSGGSPQQQELVKEFIAKNDKKQPQAYLEFSIVELSESGSQTFENTWKVWSEMFSANFDGSTHTNEMYPTFIKGEGYTLVDPSTFPPTVLQQFTKYADPAMITYTMNYLIENKKGRVLANPRIMITNGEISTIDLTSDYVKKVTSQVLGGSVAGATQKTYEIANDDGIKISLTPFISPDGYVTLNIKPEYATIKEKVWDKGIVGTDLVATLLQRRNLDLKNIRIKDGETLIIGGMIREDEQKTVSKIPVLGDLPGVGMFFRNSATTKTKQELVIMITPKIIKDLEDVVNNSDMTL
jgi:type II secretory pathway component GspD/PulD (secretin)